MTRTETEQKLSTQISGTTYSTIVADICIEATTSWDSSRRERAQVPFANCCCGVYVGESEQGAWVRRGEHWSTLLCQLTVVGKEY
eukprot:COSAG02_NODE_5298_length_4461_cov_2.071068_2_plen_85_part_00